MTLDVHQYVCQRAALAIISEIGSFRISTDALNVVNQFLDEFILLLLSNSVSVNLLTIKSVVTDLLPSTLGNNAIVEAELEVKSFAKTGAIDYISELSLNVSLLRKKCFEYCTLSDKSHPQTTNDPPIPPFIPIYITTIIEHIAEYILSAIAIAAGNEGVDYIRINQAFFALKNDPQLSCAFNRMDLKSKLEKRIGLFACTATVATETTRDDEAETSSCVNIHFDDLELEYFNDAQPRKKEPEHQPVLPPASKKNRRSTYNLFQENADVSFSLSNSSNLKLPLMNFEELFKSGETVKVSLTPKRLKSIEVEQVPAITEHKTTSLPKPSATKNTQKFMKKAFSLSLPIKKLSSASSFTPNNDKNILKMQHVHQQRSSTDARKLNANQKTPSFVYQEKENCDPFTNRASIETLSHTSSKSGSVVDTPHISVGEAFVNTALRVTPLSFNTNFRDKPPSISSPETVPSVNNSPQNSLSLISSNGSISSPASSDITTPTAVLTYPQGSYADVSTVSIQEPAIPLPTRKFNTTSTILRRSSVSSRKSRENLRKLKEQQQGDEPLPGPIFIIEPEELSSDDSLAALEREPEERDIHILPSTIVAKRLSMLNDGRKSYNERSGTKKCHSQQSVSVSIKQWDQLNNSTVLPPVRNKSEPRITNTVLDKVLKYERSMEEHQPLRKEKFIYLQQQSSLLIRERKNVVKPIVRRIEGIDQGVQTDLDDERGDIDGDEEWFLDDNEWEEQDETLIVEWLLGE